MKNTIGVILTLVFILSILILIITGLKLFLFSILFPIIHSMSTADLFYVAILGASTSSILIYIFGDFLSDKK